MMHYRIATVLSILLCGLSFSSFSQNVGINTSGATPSKNAILDLNTGNNRNLGLIVPHVSLKSLTSFSPPIANANTTSDTGLTVYNTNSSVGNGIGCYCWNGSQWVFAGYISNKASYQASPSNPSATKSTYGVMMGLKGYITPTSSGTVLIIISGIAYNTGNNDGVNIQIYTGTGTAPNNGGTITGTAQGTQLEIPDANTTNPPFTLNALITGLTPNTTYWIDLSLSSGYHYDYASLSNISISAVEE